jgi:hypothetical protein
MADIHGSPGDAPQLPAAPGAGPAPVPYSGADLSPQEYGPEIAAPRDPGSMDVMAGVSGNGVQESGYAHDPGAGLVTPFYGGAISPVDAMGDPDAGGRDDVADSVAGAVTAAEARYHEHASDATNTGPSQIGDALALTPVDSNPGVGDNSPWGPFPPGEPPSGSFT